MHTLRDITLQLSFMFLLYTSSILLGRLAALCSHCLLQLRMTKKEIKISLDCPFK
jgi:hypothetical protein